MENRIDYHDIQANLMVNYTDFGYLKARYLMIAITNGDKGRAFVSDMQKFITHTPNPHTNIAVQLPKVTTNIAFTYNGLKKLGLPVLTLQSFPDEFIIGMRGRRTILGFDEESAAEHWDEVFNKEIHILLTIDAKTVEALENHYQEIYSIIQKNDGIHLLDGFNNGQGQTTSYQDASALYENGYPTSKEHFGYTDGISNPFFKGMTEEMGNVLGGGKKIAYGDPRSESNWAALETGEFILGYKDEALEYPVAPMPPLLSKNGTFMTFSKFHENVESFNQYLDHAVDKYKLDKEILAAKFVGRWRNGAPITTFPNKEDADKVATQRQQALAAMATAQTTEELLVAKKHFNEINKDFIAFDYDKDVAGGNCPVGAHTRRSNPRGSLEFGNQGAFDTPGALDNRRRIIRRGLPYGTSTPPYNNKGNHGTIIITLTASIKRQFEFVFQQWINYGNDFKLANDKDPLVGNHVRNNGRMVLQGDSSKGEPPHFLCDIPRFIESRGGEYFFLPSITAINMIAQGLVDPT